MKYGIQLLFIPSLLISGATFGLGVSYSLDDIFKYYPSAIDQVITCGNWDTRPDYGKYRVIHASMFAASFLYIMKVEMDDRVAIYKPRGTISIDEFNNDHAEVSLSALSCTDLHTGIQVSATAYYGHEDIERTIKITIPNSKLAYTLKESPALDQKN